MATTEIIIVGGGFNGLVAAAILARAGHRPLVLEARSVLGGLGATEELPDGCRVPAMHHGTGILDSPLCHELQLARHGLEVLPREGGVFVPQADGAGLLLPVEPKEAAAEIRGTSRSDADRYLELCGFLEDLSNIVQPVLSKSPQEQDSRSWSDLKDWLGLGAKVRRLGQSQMMRLFRWIPMSLRDFLNDTFETELLKAGLAGDAALGSHHGPWAPHTTLNWFHARLVQNVGRQKSWPRGGPGGLARALANSATASGATIRKEARVQRILAVKGRIKGVQLQNGETISGEVILSSLDPRSTFLGLCDPAMLEPRFLWKVFRWRTHGATAKVDLVLSGLPTFGDSDDRDGTVLQSAIRPAKSLEVMERAADAVKYGRVPETPWLEMLIPTAFDPSLAASGRHVASVQVQYVPRNLRDSSWELEREKLGDHVVSTLARVCPDLVGKIVHRRVTTPEDLERRYGVSGGHVFHGEHAPDQLFFFRPFVGYANYQTPLKGLYLCGAGTHPGGGLTGLPGQIAARRVVADIIRGDT